jgi:hypothetical protein
MNTNNFHSILSLFILLLLLNGCALFENHKQKNTVCTTGNIVFNASIDSLLHLFVQKTNCKDCYYEMYIDKRDVNETIICLRSSLKYPQVIKDNDELLTNYLEQRKPSLYTKIDDIIIFVYTGIEDIIAVSSYDENIKLHNSQSSYYEYTWIIKKDSTQYNVFENSWITPFEKLEFDGVIKYDDYPASADL